VCITSFITTGGKVPTFGERSRKNLESCDAELQDLFNEVVENFDCSVLCGHRTEEEQNEVFREGKSTVNWPESRHNFKPSRAVDVVPYPIDWKNLNRFYMFGGYVKGIAKQKGISIRWGGDWDSDTLTDDQKFMDLPHFELANGE
jgi:peptidoglycan L-alanyl-D-glutamate endopeptidase CwlK